MSKAIKDKPPVPGKHSADRFEEPMRKFDRSINLSECEALLARLLAFKKEHGREIGGIATFRSLYRQVRQKAMRSERFSKHPPRGGVMELRCRISWPVTDEEIDLLSRLLDEIRYERSIASNASHKIVQEDGANISKKALRTMPSTKKINKPKSWNTTIDKAAMSSYRVSTVISKSSNVAMEKTPISSYRVGKIDATSGANVNLEVKSVQDFRSENPKTADLLETLVSEIRAGKRTLVPFDRADPIWVRLREDSSKRRGTRPAPV